LTDVTFGVIIDLSNETKNRSRKELKMTKKAMVDRMIELGIYKKSDRSYVMRNLKEYIERTYNEAVPIRIEYLKSQGIDVR